LTHVNVRVRDVKESETFYRELFGLPRVHDVVGAAYALDLPGGGFISLCPMNNPDCGMTDPPALGDIDHFGLGVHNFKEGTTARQLKERGLETYDAGSSVFIKDPNGAWVQVSAPKESFRT
jgi:catechol 2,3-dioxygenase-like lactoylglutathione lyase family enzyme